MNIKQFQVDAFTNVPFKGNPAAVIVSEQPLPEALMREIAAENNLSETAYVVAEGESWRIRWFTPTVEVDLCGHATLAAGWVLATEYGLLTGKDSVELLFNSRGGELVVVVSSDKRITLDFPAQQSQPVAVPAAVARGLGLGLGLAAEDVSCIKATISNGNYIVVLPTEAQVTALRPDMAELATVDDGGVIVTAPGDTTDFVSRFFAPFYGIDEDPVTGSAHCSLVPYWADRLSKQSLSARQVSERSGNLQCQLAGDRVLMTGQAVTVCETHWRLPL